MVRIRDIHQYLVQVISVSLLAFASSAVIAHQHFASVNISSEKVANNLYMLQGEGGNIAVLIGDDGVLMVDDQFAELTDKIRKEISKYSDGPIKYMVNTHWHYDHTGGNNNLGEQGVAIVAHDNVRSRLAAGGFIKAFNATIPPAPKAALPVITFADGLTFHWNQETISVEHVAPAHTDGDAVIYFKNANVVHTGDLYFNSFYPFVDASSKGSLPGMIEGVNRVLAKIDDKTLVIPGHGALSNKAELAEYRDMLVVLHGRLSALKTQGKTVQEIIAAKPTAEFDAKWGDGLIPVDQWLGLIYDVL